MTSPAPLLRCWVQPGHAPSHAHAFRLAAHTLVTDAAIDALAPFALEGIASGPLAQPPKLAGTPALACRSKGWIAGATRDVEVWRRGHALDVRIARAGEFHVGAGGVAVARLDASLDRGLLDEVLLGPPLVLALAQHGVWCLHASAVTIAGRGAAFLGESGMGKSTLGAHLPASAADAVQRIADDTLPVSLGPRGAHALPHFPQLKLAATEQYPLHASPRLPLAGVFVIARAGTDDAVHARRLSERQAMQALIRHTVGARVFTPQLLAAHLMACAAAAAKLPAWRLAYPRRLDALPRVREAVLRALAEAGA